LKAVPKGPQVSVETPVSEIVAIGREIDSDELDRLFESCLADN
jgi:hypothetical protein